MAVRGFVNLTLLIARVGSIVTVLRAPGALSGKWKRVVILMMNVVLVLVPDHSAHISDNEQHCSWCYDRLCGFVR